MLHVIKCTKEFALEDSQIDDIMADGLEFGIGHWCGSVEVIGDYLGEYASDQISRGGELLLRDLEDYNNTNTLNLEKFLEGFKVAVENNYFSGDLDSDYDAEVADVIVQCAVFGDIVFG